MAERAASWALIMAGGDGTRLRPLTRLIAGDERPKQFCRILGPETLLERTRRRVALAIPPDQTLVAVTRAHEPLYRPLLADMPRESLIIQPENRGTSPAILYALLRLSATAPGAVVAVFPSDHYVSDDHAFMAQVDAAVAAARLRPDVVILLGITPDRAEPGYGWIEPAGQLPGAGSLGVRRVRRFWEKPPADLARTLAARGCLWNSFVMVGRLSAFLSLIRHAVPALTDAFAAVEPALNTLREAEAIRALYARLPDTDFSRRVLGACPPNLAVLPVRGVTWSDLGEPRRVAAALAAAGLTLRFLEFKTAGLA
jgi:mannose-1-phosphate guanylyltransferase